MMQFYKINEIDAAALVSLRAYWYRDDPSKHERGEKVRPRALRFAVVGDLDGGAWRRRVAELLTGTLDPSHAPCLRHADRIRSVRHGEVEWTSLEPREWAALRAMGLPADVALSLAADEPAEHRPSGRQEVTRATLLPALHAALATWGDDALRPQADALRGALRLEVLSVLASEGLRGAARALGVSVSTLQRWKAPGGCLEG